ncbi:hypothetical protein TNCV_3616071 [Trichonephila clavipes]|nr:hypothetical protein TNCV_3616071 [Trichonephila clavipes]
MCTVAIHYQERNRRYREGRESVGDDGHSGRPQISHAAERVNINVALFSYMRAFGDGPRNFESRSGDGDDT